ncbi:MAG: WXG100 family type VII secretion target [Pseudonocardia sp.]|nr:WXG100 family type VII secretion target [Pseudonocardia sp.]
MDGFNATPEELAGAARFASTTHGEVSGELGRLAGRMEQVRAGWSGDAQLSFAAVMERWNTSARSLNEALDGIATALGASGTAYATQDAEASTSISRISEALG